MHLNIYQYLLLQFYRELKRQQLKNLIQNAIHCMSNLKSNSGTDFLSELYVVDGIGNEINLEVTL